MDFVYAPKDNLIKMVLALTILFVKLEQNGTENSVLEFHAFQEPHSPVHVIVVKPLFMYAQQGHIGMEADVFSLLTSAQQV